MILDLKDKLDGFGVVVYVIGLFVLFFEEVGSGLVWDEVWDGLKVLGYIDSEFDKVWLKLKKDVILVDFVDVLMKCVL